MTPLIVMTLAAACVITAAITYTRRLTAHDRHYAAKIRRNQ